jgi:hypothetical protein
MESARAKVLLRSERPETASMSPMKNLRALSAWVLPRRRRLHDGTSLDAPGRDRMLEPLCVVAIIMLLLAFAFDAYLPALKRFMLTEAASMTAGYKVAIAEELAVRGALPQAIETGDTARRPIGKYFDEITWSNGEIVLTLGAVTAAGMLPDAELAGAVPLTLSFRVARTETGNRLALLCGLAEPPPGFTAAPTRFTTVPARFLPSHCRI